MDTLPDIHNPMTAALTVPEAAALMRVSRNHARSRFAVAAMQVVAQKLGVGSAETVRKWVRQAEVDQGARTGTSSEGRRSSSG